MPFRALSREFDASHDFHNPDRFHLPNPQLAIVDPDAVDYQAWHEMDFTTTPLESCNAISAPSSQKYAFNMDTDLDPSAYAQAAGAGSRQQSTDVLAEGSTRSQISPDGPPSSADIYSPGSFSYSQLLDMPSAMSPMNDGRLESARSDMLRGSLSASDSLNTSPPVASLDPIAMSIQSKNDPAERLCPLIAGQIDTCQPSRCGPDAPCMNFTTLPPIEECTSVPCITAPTATMDTMGASKDGAVSLHPVSTTNARAKVMAAPNSSAARRTSSSSVGKKDLSSSRSTAAAARRRTRASANTTKSNMMGSDDENGQRQILRSGAVSKDDAKRRAKQAHSLVERKYRENLNAKITLLHNTLVAAHYGPRIEDDDEENETATGKPAAAAGSKVRKSDVLMEAMDYVNQTEVEMRHMENEIRRLSDRVRTLEKLVRCEDCSLLKQMVGLQVQPS